MSKRFTDDLRISPDLQTPAETVFRTRTRRQVAHWVRATFDHLYDGTFFSRNLAVTLFDACAIPTQADAIAYIEIVDFALFDRSSGSINETGPVMEFIANKSKLDIAKISKGHAGRLETMSMIQSVTWELLDYIRIRYPERFYAECKDIVGMGGPKINRYKYDTILLGWLFREARTAVILGWPDEDLTPNHVRRVQSVVKAYTQLRGQSAFDATCHQGQILEAVVLKLKDTAPTTLADCQTDDASTAFVAAALDEYYGRLRIPWSSPGASYFDESLNEEIVDSQVESGTRDSLYLHAQMLLRDERQLTRPIKAFLTEVGATIDRPKRGAPLKYTEDDVEQGKVEFMRSFRSATSTSANVIKIGGRHARK